MKLTAKQYQALVEAFRRAGVEADDDESMAQGVALAAFSVAVVFNTLEHGKILYDANLLEDREPPIFVPEPSQLRYRS